MAIGSTPKSQMDEGKSPPNSRCWSGSIRSNLTHVSSHSTHSSAVKEGKNIMNLIKHASTFDLSQLSPFSAQSVDTYINPDDLKVVLAEKVKRRYHDILKALKNFDSHETGKVVPFHLKNVLRIFCYPFDSGSFDNLLQMVPRDKKGLIRYTEFLHKLASDDGPLNADDQKGTTERSSISGSTVSDMNIEQLELKIKCKIGRNLKNIIRSMWLYDYNQDGFIQKKELRTILENYCCKMSDNQFRWLWNRYGDREDLVSYKNFLTKLGMNVETFQRFMSRDAITKSLCWVDHPFGFSPSEARKEVVERRYAREERNAPYVQGQKLEDIVKMFKQKVERNAPLLLNAFMVMDSSRSGYLHISVLHRTLNFFVMPMSPALFMQLVESLGITFPASKKVCWYEFLKAITCGKTFSPKKDNFFPKSRSSAQHSCSFIVEQIKRKGKRPQDFFKKVFTGYDQNKKLVITRTEFKRALDHMLVPPPSEQQFHDLMTYLDPGHTNVIDCEIFFSFLESMSKEVPSENHGKNAVNSVDDIQPNYSGTSNLHHGKLAKKMKKCVDKNYKNIEKALFTLDTEETGFIPQLSLKSVLDNFCFPLSEMQFEEIILPVKGTNDFLNYNEFLNFYKKSPFEDEKKWVRAVGRLTDDEKAVPKKFSFEELMVLLKELLWLHKDDLLQEFKSIDVADLGVVSKEDFVDILKKYTYRMEPEQFNILWNQMPKNDFGYLKYHNFMQEWAKIETKQPSQRSLSRRISADHPVNMADGVCSRPSSHMEKAGSESCSQSQKRPKTASCVSSVNREALNSVRRNNGFPNRPRSAAALSFTSSCTRKKLSVSSMRSSVSHHDQVHENLIIEGKAVEGTTPRRCIKNFKKSLKEGHEPKKQDVSLKIHKQKEDQFKFGENTHLHPEVTPGKNVENYLQHAISERWRDMLRRCRSFDEKKDGLISCEKLIDVLKNTGIHMSDEIQNILASKYHICPGATVNYWDFLQKFILFLGTSNVKNLMRRRCLPQEKARVAVGEESSELYRILLMARDKVVKNSRILWQKFCKSDTKSTGLIDFAEFQKILNEVQVKITENDAFYLKDYYDVNLTGKISYLKFLQSFIKA